MNILQERQCKICCTPFIPKPHAYNALYCSSACKTRGRPKKKILYTSKYYLRMKQEYGSAWLKRKESDRNQRAALRQWLSDYKTERGCVDCGYKEFGCALQFDHMGKKTASISELRSSKKRILKEIEEGDCVIRCANCHAIKTWRDKNDIYQGFSRS